MNIIEQLGGYEKAKEELTKLESWKHDAYSWSRMIQSESIKNALLEYRRQHNIFEVGDLVIDATDCHSNDLLTVKSISGSLLACEGDDLNASYALSEKHNPSFYVRHVTDAEIKAGKRLES